MRLERFIESARDPRLVARTSLAAAQWESHLLRSELAQPGAACISPPLITLARWLTEVWEQRLVARPELARPALITPTQSRTIWRQTVAESKSGQALISASSAAAWAEDAWRLLSLWHIDPESLHANVSQPDYRAFLAWSHSYRDRLAAEQWIDRPGRLRALGDQGPTPASDIGLLDPFETAPAHLKVFQALQTRGVTIESWPAPEIICRPRAVVMADAREELRAAANWAALELARDPAQTIAVVVPNLSRRHAEVRAAFEDELERDRTQAESDFAAPLWIQHGRSLADVPAFGAACTAIELTSTRGNFATLSRWLRSPFFSSGADGCGSSGAMFEAKLRGQLHAQLSFVEAFRFRGLRELMRQELPEAAKAFDAVLGLVERLPPQATPTQWAAHWQASLRELGWRNQVLGTPAEALDAWEAALAEFASLTAVVGAIRLEQAVDQLLEIVRATDVVERLPLNGVHVLGAVTDLGPGYSRVWVTEFTDRFWPQSVALNPLLPRSLQLRYAMPQATPALAYAASKRDLDRLLKRVPLAIFSTPRRIQDQRVEPSAMLRDLEPATVDVLGANFAAKRFGARELETIENPPPALAGSLIRGGARALDFQARCPIRAFCEFRLGVQALEAPLKGLSPRLQGIAMHRALELLFRPLVGAEAIDIADAQVAACVDRALGELVPWSALPFSVFVALERRRMTESIARLLELEAKRSSFRVVAVEQRADIEVGHWTLQCRIDRIDAVEPGDLIIFDYKTGRHASVGGWFKPRLVETQLPLYAQQLRPSLAAVVIVSLAGAQVEYKGSGRLTGSLPAKLRAPSHGSSFDDQIERWGEQLQQLVSEFAAGDTRILAADYRLAAGVYAPLTRVHEYLATQQGVVET